MKYQKPRGTVDFWGDKARQLVALYHYLAKQANIYGYDYIETPIYEQRDVFMRSVGVDSDIVKKEFFAFEDKNHRQLVLRPENTASVIRAVVENKLLEQTFYPLKYYYLGDMFRYERPQSGRLRQFKQFGVECIGSSSFWDDLEILKLAVKTLTELGLLASCQLKINYLGNEATKNCWNQSLSQYFALYKEQLSPISQARIATNPLRILDDKYDGVKKFVLEAPRIKDFYSPEQKLFWQQFLTYLDNEKITYVYDEKLVRGLDYYTGIIFEFIYQKPTLVGQSTICGGGRYGKLLQEFNSKIDLEGVGFAIGINRLMIALNTEKNLNLATSHFDLYLACLVVNYQQLALKLVSSLREMGLSVLTNWSTTKLEKHFKIAAKSRINHFLILGENEVENQFLTLKNQLNLTQTTIPFNSLDLINTIIKRF